MDGYAEFRIADEITALKADLVTANEKIEKLKKALAVYGDRNNYSEKIMRQGREVYMPKNNLQTLGPELAEKALEENV